MGTICKSHHNLLKSPQSAKVSIICKVSTIYLSIFIRFNIRSYDSYEYSYDSVMNFVYFTFVATASLLSGVKCENVTHAELDERAGQGIPFIPHYVERDADSFYGQVL